MTEQVRKSGQDKQTQTAPGKTVFVQKKYRDALFRKIFHQKDVLLELYNALTQYLRKTAGHDPFSTVCHFL